MTPQPNNLNYGAVWRFTTTFYVLQKFDQAYKFTIINESVSQKKTIN